MSLYNMMNGVNPATFFILPMLGKHPDYYPRFRDCFIGTVGNSETDTDEFGIPRKKQDFSKQTISVYTRVGGGNRDSYEKEITELRKMKGYIEDYDDDFDCTFATFVYEVPEEFVKDYQLIKEGKIKKISKRYKDRLYEIYPKLKEHIDEIFKSDKV